MGMQLLDLNALVQDAQGLDPLPASATRLAALLSGDDWDLDEVTEIVRLDQALTGRILGVANSAMSGAAVHIPSVDQAVVRMGPGKILSLALGAVLCGHMQDALPEFGLVEGQLWIHSVAVALAAEESRAHIGFKLPPHAFAAALLHDVGKLVMARHLSREALGYLHRAMNEGGLSRSEAEAEVLEVQHAELGGLIARSWKLPEVIAEAVQFHHSPREGPDEACQRLAQLIALCDAAAVAVGADGGTAHPLPVFADEEGATIGMDRAGFEMLCDAVAERLEDVLAVYS